MGKTTNVISLDMGGTDYQAQSDMRTLAQAEVIKADKKRYAAACKMAKDQIEALENIDPAADAKEDAATGEKD